MHATHATLTPVPRTLASLRLDRFERLNLRAHHYLAGIPLHSLDALELPGGPRGLALPEIARRIGFTGEAIMPVGRVTEFLFWLRGQVGRVLHWDGAKAWPEAESFVSRLGPADRVNSLIAPGTPAGISRVMFQSDAEMIAEIINRTVHCFWVMAREPQPYGYTVWLAVYVQRRNWFTPVYMAAISPMLRWIIYPAMLRGARQRWHERLGAPAGGPA